MELLHYSSYAKFVPSLPCLVGQHWLARDISYGVDSGLGGASLFIHLNETALVDLARRGAILEVRDEDRGDLVAGALEARLGSRASEGLDWLESEESTGDIVAITKTPPRRDVSRGDLVPYTITVHNQSTATIADLTVEEQLLRPLDETTLRNALAEHLFQTRAPQEVKA